MASVTVRIDREIRDSLRQLAAKSGTTMQEVLKNALEHYQKDIFWKEFNASFVKLKKDGNAWTREQQERAEWDTTLADGLEDDAY
jgi:predicted transcriptional regulator